MTKKAYVFLAEGFEEVEALTPIDLLRRVGVEVITVSVTGEKAVCGSHQIPVVADLLFEEMNYEGADLLVLPGGMPGTLNLKAHEGLTKLLIEQYEDEKYIAAICAAPMVFGGLGFLNGRKASIYPGMEEELIGANVSFDPVSVDEHVVTSRGVGTAIPFALELIALLCGREKADQIGKAIVYYV